MTAPDNTDTPTLNPEDEALLATVEDDAVRAKLAERLSREDVRTADTPADTGPRSPKPDPVQGMDRTPRLSGRAAAEAAFEEYASERLRGWQP